jgi:hypothetical protein
MLLSTENISQEGGGPQKTMVIRDVCPRCHSSTYKQNGHLHHGTQNHRGQDCGRQFGACCEPSLIAGDTRALIERLLVARIAWRGMCRAGGVNRKGLLGCLVQGIAALPDHLHVQLLCHDNLMKAAVQSEHYMDITPQMPTVHARSLLCSSCLTGVSRSGYSCVR